MGLQLVTPASDLLVPLADAKLACRIDDTVGSVEDDWLTRKIRAATAEIEAFVGRSVQEQGWLLALDGFSDAIELPRGPVSAIGSILYDDPDGTEQTLGADIYALDLVSDPQWIVRNSGESWPSLLDAVNVVRIAFTAGFDEDSPDLALVQDVCLDVVAFWYENRGGDAAFPKWAKDRLRVLRKIII